MVQTGYAGLPQSQVQIQHCHMMTLFYGHYLIIMRLLLLLLLKLPDQWGRFEERKEESNGMVQFLRMCHCFIVVHFLAIHKKLYLIIITRICLTLILTAQVDGQVERHLANICKK